MAPMNQRERSALQSCRPTLVRDIEPHQTMDYLVGRGTITDDDEQRVSHEATRMDKNRKLLEILLTKPSQAFQDLLYALNNSNQTDLAKMLKDQYQLPVQRNRSGSITDIGNLLIASGVPLKPDVLIERPFLVEKIRDAIKAMAGQPGWVLVHGMGGIGKTTIVAQSLRDQTMLNNYYANGVVWFKMGKLRSAEELLIKMISLLQRLSLDKTSSSSCSTIEEAHNSLRQLLVVERPNTLLVLDDLWDSKTAKWFNAGGNVLVTSRDASVLERVQRVQKVEVSEGFTLDQSNEIFVKTLGINSNELLPEWQQLWEKCGKSPLAISMIAAQLKQFPLDLTKKSKYYVKTLEQKKLDRVRGASEYEYDTLFNAIGISIDDLPANLRENYTQLAVFPRGRVVSPGTLATLWNEEDEDTAEDIIHGLMTKSLAWREWNEESQCYVYGIHDLQYSVLRQMETTDPDRRKNLNETLVKQYLKQCEDGKWHNLPRDGYIFWFIGYHLYGAGRQEELVNLLTDLEFVEAKLGQTGPADLINDYLTYKKTFEEHNKGPVMQAFLSFVRRNANLMKTTEQELSSIVVQLGLCQEDGSPVFEQALKLASENRRRQNAPYWLWKNSGKAPPSVNFRTRVCTSFIYSVHVNDADSKVLVSNHDGLVVLLDAWTGLEVCAFQVDESEVYRAAFIDSEGAKFVTCADSGQISIFKLPEFARQEGVNRTGSGSETVDHCWMAGGWEPKDCRVAVYPDEPKEGLPGGQRSQPRCCCIGHDSIYVGCQDGTVSRYTTLNDRIYHSSDHSTNRDAIMAISLSHCGRFVATASVDKRSTVLDFEELEIVTKYAGHDIGLTGCLFVPGQSRQVVTAAGNDIHVWRFDTDSESASMETMFEVPRNTSVMSLAISHDARYLAAGLSNNAIKLWKFATGEHLYEFWGHNGYPLSLCFDRRRERLFSAGDDATLHSWDLSLGTGAAQNVGKAAIQVRPTFAVHWARPGDGADRTLVAAQDLQSNSLLLLDAATCDVARCDPPLPWRVLLMAFTADGRRLALGTEKGHVIQFEVGAAATPSDGDGDSGGQRLRQVHLWRPPSHSQEAQEPQPVACLQFVCDEKRLAVGYNDGQVWVLSAEPETEQQQLEGHREKVSALAEVTVGGRRCLLSASFDGSARLWPVDASGRVDCAGAVVVCQQASTIFSVDFLPSRSWLLTTWADKKARVWKDARGAWQLHRTFADHSDCVRVGRFCPGPGARVATGDDRGTVLVWDAETGDVVRSLSRPATDEFWISDLHWAAPDRLLTASGCVRLWSAASGALLQAFHPRGSEVTKVSVRPDSQADSLVAVDTAGTLYILESVG